MFWNLEIPPYRILPPVLFLVLSFCRISKFVVPLEFVFLFYFILTLQRLLQLQLYCCFINEYIYKYVYGVKFSPLSSFFVYLFTQFLSFFFQPKKMIFPFLMNTDFEHSNNEIFDFSEVLFNLFDFHFLVAKYEGFCYTFLCTFFPFLINIIKIISIREAVAEMVCFLCEWFC